MAFAAIITSMNVLIRVVQALLALTTLNGAFGLVVYVSLSVMTGGKNINVWTILGALVSIFAYCVLIFLLQRYHEKRSGKITSPLSGQKYSKIALTSLAVAAFAGFATVVGTLVMAVVLLLNQ